MSIQPGDLVMAVRPRPCGCPASRLGWPFIVTETVTAEWECMDCGYVTAPTLLANFGGAYGWIHANRLKKIDPPSTPEHVEHREELTA